MCIQYTELAVLGEPARMHAQLTMSLTMASQLVCTPMVTGFLGSVKQSLSSSEIHYVTC